MSLSFSGGTLKTREIVLVIVTVVAVVLCLVFLGLYATKQPSDNNNNINQEVTAGLHGSTPKPMPATCDTPMCLETTAYVWSLVNTSANPCEDFYTYACGNWAKRHPLHPNDHYTNVIHNLYLKNEQRIRALLESPKTRDVPWGSERKAKDLYKSCLNEFGRMKAGANPFIEKVLTPVGGWYVLGNFQSNTWDLLTHIEKVHVDFWTDVLFAVRVETDWTSPENRLIELQSPPLGLSSWYYSSPYSNTTRMAYQDYMRTVAGLLVRDSGVTITDADKTNRINVFISDVMQMETMLANISSNSGYDYTSYEQTRRVRIQDLANLTGTTFEWVSFFSYMFDKAQISKSTFIVVPEREYIRKMAQAINNMGDNKNRILNNYFTWSLVRNFIYDMSSEYTHAARNFENTLYGVTEFIPTWEQCFSFVASHMKDAMSHLYVQAHFGDGNKEKVGEIADYIKNAITDSLTGSSFMDAATQTYAKDKIKAIVENLGYPDYVADQDSVDNIYAHLKVHDTDYFQNVLNMNKFLRVDLNNQLQGSRADPDEWGYYGAFSTSDSYMGHLNKLVVPAGLLQHPIYDYHLAHYLNFGSMGTILARDYLLAIDVWGSWYDKHGDIFDGIVSHSALDYYQGWWSNTTQNKYKNIRDCIMDAAANRTEGTYADPVTGDLIPVITPSIIWQYQGDEIAEDIWRIKVALMGYKAWIAKNGKEPLPPSVGLNNQQMYFVAYAQTQCYARSDWYQHFMDRYGAFRESFKINMAVSQVKEFSDAFRCPKTAKLNPANRCNMN